MIFSFTCTNVARNYGNKTRTAFWTMKDAPEEFSEGTPALVAHDVVEHGFTRAGKNHKDIPALGTIENELLAIGGISFTRMDFEDIKLFYDISNMIYEAIMRREIITAPKTVVNVDASHVELVEKGLDNVATGDGIEYAEWLLSMGNRSNVINIFAAWIQLGFDRMESKLVDSLQAYEALLEVQRGFEEFDHTAEEGQTARVSVTVDKDKYPIVKVTSRTW